MKIAVNTRLLLDGSLDGIGWFTYETLSRIVKNHPEHEFHFIFDRPYSQKFIFAENVIPHVVHPQARLPILFRIWYNWSVPRKLKKIGADIFISTDAMASLNTTVKQLVVIHDLNFEHHPNDLPKRFAGYWRKYSRQFALKADRIGTVSQFSKEDIMELYGIEEKKIDVVYNGAAETYRVLDPGQQQKVRNELSNGAGYFLFVGTIHPRKNLQRLLPAFDQFKKQTNSDCKLVVVGKKYWFNDEIETAYNNMTHRDDVIFTGAMELNRLTEVMASALALVYISYFEGFGIPIVEAFRSGTPVITSNVTSMPEIASDAAILVNPFSIEEISEAMIRVHSDDGLRKNLIEKGTSRAQEFNWDKTALHFWQSIIKTLEPK